ncbi:MAG: glycosyl transferase [Schleiferiaceae bacterium]|nr:glycosyl transferase [Schleiferiaceae bacterium]
MKDEVLKKPARLKILYAFQGTGNGHSARALALYPAWLASSHDVDFVISGRKSQLKFPFPTLQLSGIVLQYGKSGGVAWGKTLLRNNWWQFFSDIIRLDVSSYDVIVNDFEPVSAWKARWVKKTILGLSHQAAVVHPLAPKPLKNNYFAEVFMRWFAPANTHIGFHFLPFAEGVLPPLQTTCTETLQQKRLRKSCLVYLPAFGLSHILNVLERFPLFHFTVFHPDVTNVQSNGNVVLHPVDKERFTRVFAQVSRVICSAGFELPAEALANGKQLLAIPIKKQYEQYCNAAALKGIRGATVATRFSAGIVGEWLIQRSGPATTLLETITPEEVLRKVLEKVAGMQLSSIDLE